VRQNNAVNNNKRNVDKLDKLMNWAVRYLGWNTEWCGNNLCTM